MRRIDLQFDYILTGPNGTRGGSVIAETRADAMAQVDRETRDGERLYTLAIRS